MRFSLSQTRASLPRTFLILLSATFFVLSLSGCPKQEGSRKRLPEYPYEESGVSSPTNGAAVEAKRSASQRMVEKGIAALNAGDAAEAQQRFQEAVNIDPSNGIAYYYLARVAFEEGRSDEALGLLDKASVLVGEDLYWKEQVQELHYVITGESQNHEGTDLDENTF